MYKSVLDLRETQVAIKECKDYFERELAKALNLIRVTAKHPEAHTRLY
jgi:aspartate--ammonia ligase